jgi:hypothetical protein
LLENGVFAEITYRTYKPPWADHLKIRHSMMVNDLKENNRYGEETILNIQLFTPKLESHFMFLAYEF